MTRDEKERIDQIDSQLATMDQQRERLVAERAELQRNKLDPNAAFYRPPFRIGVSPSRSR